MAASADVVIIGGSVVGSSVAWNMRYDGFTGRIVVIERDPTYARASAFLAMGGIRQQFCTAVTVQMCNTASPCGKPSTNSSPPLSTRPGRGFDSAGIYFSPTPRRRQR